MNRNQNSRIAVLFLPLVLSACTAPDSLNVQEYYEWMNNPEHGLVQYSEVGDVKLTVKYLSSNYLTYLYMQSEGGGDVKQKNRDSITAAYKNSLGFLLTFSPVSREGKESDIMLSGVHNYQEYVSRFMTMNFRIPEFVTLRAGGYESAPVLANSENSYGLTTKRDVLLIFPNDPKIWKSEILTISFDDRIMETGISHFAFRCEQLQNVPSIRY